MMLNDTVVIRRALPEDVPAIARLWLAFMQYNAAFDDAFAIKQKMMGRFTREVLQRLGETNHRLAVAELSKEIVGYCYSYISRKPYFFVVGKFGLIADLFVVEEYRGHGIGRLLVEDAHDYFRRRGVKQSELLVAEKNVDTIRFCEQLGYRKLLQWMCKNH